MYLCISFLGYAESAGTVLSAFHILIILTLKTTLWGVDIVFFPKRQILIPSHMLVSANNLLIFFLPDFTFSFRTGALWRGIFGIMRG